MRFAALLLIVTAAAALAAAPMLAAEKTADTQPKDPAESFEEALEDDPAETPPATDPADDGPQENADKPGDGQDEAPGEVEQALNLKADQIVYQGDGFTCTKNVVITYGEARIECDKVVGTIGEVEKDNNENGEKTKGKAITYLVATGEPVTMVSKQRRARCHKAVYDLIEGKLVLTGPKGDPPELIQEGRTISSPEIIYLFSEKRFILKDRGEVTIPIPNGKLPDILK
ncbi:MAG: hypothetical protein HQ592_00905 [Planctomycetes bacterium]|nr:hypothetical protein [Planctomycetota bacterium]